MARNKVRLAWIANDATRRATMKKRRKGLLKKVRELSILCGVEACAVVYAPGEQQPVAWPSPAEAARMMARFKSMPEIERGRKMINQETFLHQRIAKLVEQLRRQQRENREIEMTTLVFEGLRGRALHDLGIEDASALAWMVETKLRAIYEKREEIANRLGLTPLPVSLHAPLPLALPPPLPPPTLPTLPILPTLAPLPPSAMVDGALLQHQRPSWPFGEMLSPWAAAEEAGQMYADHGCISPWADAMAASISSFTFMNN